MARHQPEYTDLKINQNSTLSTPTESSILPNVTDQSALFRLLLRYMSRIYITHRNHYHQSNNTTNNNQQMYTYQAAAAALPTILCIPTRNQKKRKRTNELDGTRGEGKSHHEKPIWIFDGSARECCSENSSDMPPLVCT